MKTLMNIKINGKEDSLKYAYAFMKCEQLNMKECSFANPNPTNFDTKYILPRDSYSVSYKGETMPTWISFKENQLHIDSPAFSCVACIDIEDKKRVGCFLLGDSVCFNIYGDYERESKQIFDKIILYYSALK